MQFFIHLDDYTDRGTAWNFYEQAEIIDYMDASSDDINALRPELQFRKFQGRFGNIGERNIYLKISRLDGAHQCKNKTLLYFLLPILMFLKLFENIKTKIIEIRVF